MILAAVSIATLTGENGILTKAQTAQGLTKQENAKEKVQVEVLGSLENSGNIDLSELNKNLEKVEGITDGLPIESLPAELTVDGCKVKIDGNGKVTVEGEVAEDPTNPPKTPTFENVNTAETNPAGSMPEGATVVEPDANEGIVIKDTNDNEWVWIEVPKLQSKMPADIEFTNETGYSEDDQEKCDSITVALKTYADPYTKGSAKQIEDPDYNNWTDEWYEGCGLTPDGYKEKYQKMIKSVYKNGGFWIGRYEAGIEGTTGTDFSKARTSKDNPINATQVIIQKDAIPYNYVMCNEAETLVEAISTDSSKTSSLLFGIQWDLVCKFLEVKSNDLNVADINSDSEKWGNYYNVEIPIVSSNAKSAYEYYDDSDEEYYFSKKWTKMTEATKQAITDDTVDDCILLSTGASEKTKILNIYDFAGNEYEWTLEHATAFTNEPESFRGGGFVGDSSRIPASYRNGQVLEYASDYISFRPALY